MRKSDLASLVAPVFLLLLLALRKPLPARAPAPALLPPQAYDKLTPPVDDRLRALSQLLLQMLKS